LCCSEHGVLSGCWGVRGAGGGGGVGVGGGVGTVHYKVVYREDLP